MNRLLVLLILFTSSFAMTQTPEEVVQRQLDMYNARNLELFLETFHAECELIDFASGEVRAKGKEQLRKVYGELFAASPELHSNLLNRMVMGNKVLDHESITGRSGQSTPLELIMVYEVKDGQIIRATAIRP
jgi:hypothetical protein